MATRKYDNYILIAENGEINEETSNYSDAFSLYQHSESPKTLYGMDEMGNMSVILSK